MYTQSSIDRIREASILDVIGNYVELKKAGSLYECCSPFSKEKTPSFKVSTVKNNWVCYSTNQSGDGIKFVMQYSNCDFPEAVKAIASICNIYLEETQLTEDEIRKRDRRNELINLTNAVALQYSKNLKNLPENHWCSQMIKARQINQETIINFQLGFALDEWKAITNPLIQKGKFELAKYLSIVKSKNNNSYDFFRDRLMFPIHDIHGNVIAFGGRTSIEKSESKKEAKYLNSAESEIYNKTKTLYGIYQAKQSIVENGYAFLVEGYTDVTAMHQNGFENTVASCGTALSKEQCQLLKKYTTHVVLCRDNDGMTESGDFQKGIKAQLTDIDLLLQYNFKVSVLQLPEKEDPDSFSRKEKDLGNYLAENIQDAVLWKTQKLNIRASNDPDAISHCVTKSAEMLFCISDAVKRNEYIKKVAKLLKQPIKLLKQKVEDLIDAAEANASKTQKIAFEDAQSLGLPAGADYSQFLEKQYITHNNSIYFRGNDGFFKGANFSITPLFHIYGKENNKRLCEVVNELGQKKLIDFDTTDFTNFTKFGEKLMFEGVYYFTNIRSAHFLLLRNHILQEFIMAHDLKTLGWQKNEKFFALADCVLNKGKLQYVNNYGIIQVDSDYDTSSEYHDKITHFYSPAFSEMYKHTRDGDDPYENDRTFVYRESPVSFNKWMQQLQKVYPKKYSFGIAFCIASLFRDIYQSRYQYFPHLFLTGEKGSGKSKFGESLMAMFTYKQEAFDLNSGTPVAFYRRLSRIMNIPTMMEEYHDNVDDKIFQALKGAYDGRGREMGKATGDNRTTTTKTNCSIILLSQYLSARDDNSLTSRSIILNFIKRTEPYTQEALEDYTQLKAWEEQGMTSMLVEIMRHREEVEKNFHQTYNNLNKTLKSQLKNQHYEERMLQNYVSLLVPVKILQPYFNFPFSFESFYKQCFNAILESSDLITSSESLAEFWKILELLLDENKIRLGYEFDFATPQTLNLQNQQEDFINTENEKLLYLRLKICHSKYRLVCNTSKIEVIGEQSLRNYLKSKSYFIGTIQSHRFEQSNTSAYVFKYETMRNAGILDLSRQTIPKPVTTNDGEELAF
ncbi:DNA primase [Kordia sp. TARA_039_SRF]|nr:DNA primase [Kordia sp. TARA_039_SRF]